MVLCAERDHVPDRAVSGAAKVGLSPIKTKVHNAHHRNNPPNIRSDLLWTCLGLYVL